MSLPRWSEQRHTIPVGILAAFLAGGCAGAPSTAWCPPAADGIEVVATTGSGDWERAGVEARLVESWRAGGLNEGEELAMPITIVASPGGRVAVPDFMLGEVVVIDPDGTWLGPWTRKGQGPGEVQHAVAAAWDGDDRLVVFDVVGSKVVFVGPDGAAGEDLRVEPSFSAPVVMSGEFTWAGVRPDGAAYLQPALRPSDDDPSVLESVILALQPGATAPDTVARARWKTIGGDSPYAGFAAPGWPTLTAALTGRRIAIGGDVDLYRIVLLDETGRPVRQLCRDAAPTPITDREFGDGVDGVRLELIRAARSAPRPDRPAAFGRIVLGTEGRVWVHRERIGVAEMAVYGPAGGEWDVFAEDGRYLGAVRVPERAHLMAAAGDAVWAFEFGELDETWVVQYRLETTEPRAD